MRHWCPNVKNSPRNRCQVHKSALSFWKAAMVLVSQGEAPDPPSEPGWHWWPLQKTCRRQKVLFGNQSRHWCLRWTPVSLGSLPWLPHHLISISAHSLDLELFHSSNTFLLLKLALVISNQHWHLTCTSNKYCQSVQLSINLFNYLHDVYLDQVVLNKQLCVCVYNWWLFRL